MANKSQKVYRDGDPIPRPSDDCAKVIDAFLDAAINFGIHQMEHHNADYNGSLEEAALDIMTAANEEGPNGIGLRFFLKDRLRERGY